MANDYTDRDLDVASLLCTTSGETGGSVTPPIVQTSLFTFDDYDDFKDRMTGKSDKDIYTRIQNPTVRAFEQMMAKIESGEEAIGFASGMAAISSTILAFVKPGDRIVCVEHVYSDSYKLFERILRGFGIEISYHSLDEFENNPNLFKGIRLAYLESPNSMMFETLNLKKISSHAKNHETLTVIDNSWATPIFQRPLGLGIDIVIHSASKYISGHSDTVAGVIIGSKELLTQIREKTLALLGGKLAPFEAWLLIRGLRTLNVRMMAHQASTNSIIDRMMQLDCIKKINTPKLDSKSGLSGRTGLFSIEFEPEVNIKKLCDEVNIFKLGVSWGGFESLILPTEIALAQVGEKNSFQKFNVSKNIVRLSIGLENSDDLWADFKAALDKSIG